MVAAERARNRVPVEQLGVERSVVAAFDIGGLGTQPPMPDRGVMIVDGPKLLRVAAATSHHLRALMGASVPE